MGNDPNKELQNVEVSAEERKELDRITAQGASQQRRSETAQAAQKRMGNLADIIRSAAENPDIEYEDLKDELAENADFLAEIRELFQPRDKPLSAEELTPAHLGVGESHELDFLPELKIPTPGITVFGGKTASGKTTALINAARSLLAAGRSVALYSYEQSRKDIGLLLALSIAKQEHNKEVNKELNKKHNKEPDSPWKPEKYETLPDYPLPGDTLETGTGALDNYYMNLKELISNTGKIPPFLKNAITQVAGYIEDGKLAVWDADRDADMLSVHIEDTNFDVYLIDYIQVIPPGADHARETYKRIADIAGCLRKAVSEHGKTIIAGAQFNREKGTDATPGTGNFDPDLEQFREAADIEHVAALALGLGWYKSTEGESAYYWKILKHRYNGGAKGCRIHSGGHFKYCYVYNRSPWIKPGDWGTPGHGIGAPVPASAKKQKSTKNSKSGSENDDPLVNL